MKYENNSCQKENIKKIARKHKPVKQYLRLFLERYEEIFEHIRDQELKILEIGVGGYKNPDRGGGSLRMWSEYFENSQVIGMDLNEKNLELPSNVTFCKGSQVDTDFLERIVADYGPFDIVIDDASHVTKNTIITFDYLWPSVKKYYIIEDLHMKSAKGTEEHFLSIDGADFITKNMCVIKKT
jgi:hypothetical protein